MYLHKNMGNCFDQVTVDNIPEMKLICSEMEWKQKCFLTEHLIKLQSRGQKLQEPSFINHCHIKWSKSLPSQFWFH